MKNAAFVLFILLAPVVLVLSITGCSGRSTDTASAVVEIRENMFITQINDININYRSYLGRTIKVEGFFRNNFWGDNHWFFVIRNGPGCCGDDGEIGFEVTWDPEYSGSGTNISQRDSFPAENEWVEATGVLGSYNTFGLNRLYLVLSELKVLETRGLEFVTR